MRGSLLDTFQNAWMYIIKHIYAYTLILLMFSKNKFSKVRIKITKVRWVIVVIDKSDASEITHVKIVHHNMTTLNYFTTIN